MEISREEKAGSGYTRNRIESLSDGVFAVAMTLLVLGLSVPIITGTSMEEELNKRLLELLPRIFLYFLSFILLGLIWINHNFIFRFIRQPNSRMVWLNILLLMFTALLPFSTALIGDYWRFQTAVLIFGANGIISFGLIIALWTYARRKKLFYDGISFVNVKIRKIVDILSFTTVLIAIGISFYNPVVTLFILGILILSHVIATALGLHEYKST